MALDIGLDPAGGHMGQHQRARADLPEPGGLHPGSYLEGRIETGLVQSPVVPAAAIVLRDGFYPPGAKLAPTYVPQWRPVAEQQLRSAGHHLAALLNDALAPSH